MPRPRWASIGTPRGRCCASTSLPATAQRAARQAVRDIAIHGGVNNWYVNVQNPPKSYQFEIGYLAPVNRFYCLARSNVVSTPAPGSADTFDRNWAEVAKDCDRVYAMTAGAVEPDFQRRLEKRPEEHLHRPMGESLFTQFGSGAGGASRTSASMSIPS